MKMPLDATDCKMSMLARDSRLRWKKWAQCTEGRCAEQLVQESTCCNHSSVSQAWQPGTLANDVQGSSLYTSQLMEVGGCVRRPSKLAGSTP